jgi:hypothetical protein
MAVKESKPPEPSSHPLVAAIGMVSLEAIRRIGTLFDAWCRYRFRLFRLHRKKRRIQAHRPKSDRSSFFGDPIIQLSIAAILGILAWAIPMSWWLESILLAIVVILLVVICFRLKQHFLVRCLVLLLSIIIITPICYFSLIDRYNEAHPKKQEAEAPSFLPTPLSLKDLFDTDFSPGTGIGIGLYSEPIFGRPSGENIPVKMRIVTDFDAHSKF